ncbi:MAG: dihydrofolate reductase [Acidobacteriota bacterium]|nr:dihydrofolate reductase [Acidobacteriota bacterium]
MTLSIIAILSTNNVIGNGNRLPFRQSTDLKRFKSLTMGHHLLMGRKTYESLEAPLPGRTIVVITHDRDFHADGALTAPSIERAIEIARLDEQPFIAGGGKIFEQTIHRADRMYLTRVHAEIEGDAFFPEFDDVTEWILVDSEHCDADEKNQYPYSFLTYERASMPA